MEINYKTIRGREINLLLISENFKFKNPQVKNVLWTKKD